MAIQTETIQLDPQTVEALTRYAAGLGLSVPEFLHRHFAGPNLPTGVGDVDAWLDELSADSESAPPLPRDFSTRDVYSDHD